MVENDELTFDRPFVGVDECCFNCSKLIETPLIFGPIERFISYGFKNYVWNSEINHIFIGQN